MKRVLCPGTYDPVTIGHIDIISRCGAMFDEVIVAVVDDSYRKTTLFTADERVAVLAGVHQASAECEESPS